jgi:transcription antitermination factor NusA-like protein
VGRRPRATSYNWLIDRSLAPFGALATMFFHAVLSCASPCGRLARGLLLIYMGQDSDDVGQLRRLLEEQIPEIASGVVQIRGLARNAGRHSMVVVGAHDAAVDVVAAVVGSRGSRIKKIVAKLGGERIDVVRWSTSLEPFIGNLFAPNKVLRIRYDEPHRRAIIFLALDVIDDHVEMRLKLGSELVGWNLVLE